MEETTLQTGTLNQPPKRSKFLIFFIVSVFIIVGLFGVWQFLGLKSQKEETPTAIPTPTEFQLPTEMESPTPEATGAAKPTTTLLPTSTPKPTVDPVDKTTGLDRSTLTIEVQNGSGVVGAAKKAADVLKELGYVISSTGNADNYEYNNVTIQVKNTMSKYLALLKKDLESNYTVGTASAELTATSSADALVVVGK